MAEERCAASYPLSAVMAQGCFPTLTPGPWVHGNPSVSQFAHTSPIRAGALGRGPGQPQGPALRRSWLGLTVSAAVTKFSATIPQRPCAFLWYTCPSPGGRGLQATAPLTPGQGPAPRSP